MLTAHEMAAKVSFLLTGAAPDATLRALADNGQLLDPVVLNQQIDRLFGTPAAEATIQRFFREAYGYDRFDNFQYGSEFLDGVDTSGLNASMTRELDIFFTERVLKNNGSFSDIMQNRYSFVGSTGLAQIYQTGTTHITLPANRPGFLNRAALLSKKSGSYNSPIKRGLYVLEAVLCGTIGDPPPNAPTSVSESQIVGQYQTTRDRYTHLTMNPNGGNCIQCHDRINNLGYLFEGFDSIGRARTNERIFSNEGTLLTTMPVETRTTTSKLTGSPVTITDATDLASKLATSDKAMMCFTRYMKTFESRSPATYADNCQMNSSLNTMYGKSGSQGSLKDAFKSYILSNDFKIWSY